MSVCRGSQGRAKPDKSEGKLLSAHPGNASSPEFLARAPPLREHLASQFDIPHQGGSGGALEGVAAPGIEIRGCAEREVVDAQF